LAALPIQVTMVLAAGEVPCALKLSFPALLPHAADLNMITARLTVRGS
jgi:hypothetical protein